MIGIPSMGREMDIGGHTIMPPQCVEEIISVPFGLYLWCKCHHHCTLTDEILMSIYMVAVNINKPESTQVTNVPFLFLPLLC